MDDLDRWTRVLPLGAGAFGEVDLAWDTQSSEWVALKRFTGQDELGLLRFVIESRIRVSHPHLVRTLAFRLVDDRAWLVTQLARGGSLRGLMSRTGALPWGWVAEAVDQVLSALVALHATDVIHRDLKPANLLLRDGGAARPHLLVGDFGIATWRTVSMTGIGAAIGTPGYLAPEYLDGRQPAPATDLFAVGVLAAELLAGRRLIHYSNATPGLPSGWSNELPLPPSVPAGLATVLRRMAAPDPSHRYADCTQAREALLAAAPPAVRGDLTTVVAPDLLSSLPSGWTLTGPADGDAETANVGPGWGALPIDGGPTVLVEDAGQDETVAVLQQPATPSAGSPALPSTPPSGAALSPTSKKTPKRRLKRTVLLVVLVVLAAGAGTLWWAAEHRTIDGVPSATGSSPDQPEGTSRWTPTLVAPCSRVEIGTVRQGATGDERCQLTQNSDSAQYWVEEPAGGFPKSDAGGPFPGDTCPNEGDTKYTPVGDHVRCTTGTWQVMP